MTKEEHIEYWVSTAHYDWEVVNDLFVSKRYLHGLFFAHLTLEKLVKALWVKNNINNLTPPKTHNIIYLLNQAGIELIDDEIDFFSMVNDFQLESRYPAELKKMESIYNKQFSENILKEIEIKRQWLLKMLQ